MSVKRYTPSGVHHTSVYLDLDAEGAVVMYDDHAAEVARLQARVRELEAALAAVHLCDCNPVARAALAAVSAERSET